jgi:hypothetical protein
VNENIPLSVDTGRGLSINYLGKNLYSKYNPSKTSEKIAEKQELSEETLYIIPSPLLLYGVEILLNKLPESSYLLGIETDQQLMHLTINLSNRISSTHFKTVRLATREHLKLVIEDLDVSKYRKCSLIPLNMGYNLFKDQYDFLYEFASFILTTFWRNRLTINKLGKLWIRNILVNSHNMTSEKPDNKGKPVVVCGAGISLEETFNILKKHRNSLYIVAVDTALSALLASNIKPDLIFALESQFYNLGDFYDSIDQNIDLLTDISGYPAVCRKLNGKTYFFSSDFFKNSLLDRIVDNFKLTLKIPPLGSVGVAAVYSAIKLFNTPIFLTGLDFSFVPGKSHSKGSPFTNTQLRTTNRLNPVGSYGMAMNRPLIKKTGKLSGSIIQTDSILHSYAKLLGDILSQEKRVFDLSNSGYPIGAVYINEQEFASMINLHKNSTKKSPDKILNKSDFNVFINNEIEYLKRLINEWDLFHDSESDEIPQSLMESLKIVDYVYLDFPDRLPHPIKEISFLSRAVISARYYLEMITKQINK